MEPKKALEFGGESLKELEGREGWNDALALKCGRVDEPQAADWQADDN